MFMQMFTVRGEKRESEISDMITGGRLRGSHQDHMNRPRLVIGVNKEIKQKTRVYHLANLFLDE